jgi:DNA-damage-inducible protein J
MANINFKIDQDIKTQAEEVFAGLGLNTTQALNLFLRQVIYNQGIPFELKLPRKPNQDTLDALNDAKNGNVERCDDLNDLFSKLKN